MALSLNSNQSNIHIPHFLGRISLEVEPIMVESKYPFKSTRYPNYIMFVKLSTQEQNLIIKTLRPKYPIGAPGRDVLRNFIQNNSCNYCLQFGHTCKPNTFPPQCPNIEYDYLDWIKELSIKYGIDRAVLHYFVMTGVGFIHREKPFDKNSNINIKWPTISVPQMSRYDFELSLCKMKCENCNDHSHLFDPCPKSDSPVWLNELMTKMSAKL